MKTCTPNFLLVGASKSGTSSIYHYLRQHPQIFLSPFQKEGRFFSGMEACFQGPGDDHIQRSIPAHWEDYLRLFLGYQGEAIVGDISPEYLYHYEKAIPRIQKYLGEDVKIAIILRNPIERAYSQYLHYVRDERETLDFSEALEAEDQRQVEKWLWSWAYARSGLYYNQVKAYKDHFKNVRIFLYDSFKQNPENFLKSLCIFLKIDSTFEFDTSYKYNVSGIPKNKLLYRVERNRSLIHILKVLIPTPIINWMKYTWTGEKRMIKQTMPLEAKTKLIEFYKTDVQKLQILLKEDLSHWFRI